MTNESAEYVKCACCNELKRQNSHVCTACDTPAYDLDSAALKKFRRNAARAGNLNEFTKAERRAYGQAVEDAVLAKQRAECARAAASMPSANCASGTWHTTGEAIDKAIKSQQRAALQAYPGQERRARTPQQWETMYVAAMPEGFVPSWERETQWPWNGA